MVRDSGRGKVYWRLTLGLVSLFLISCSSSGGKKIFITPPPQGVSPGPLAKGGANSLDKSSEMIKEESYLEGLSAIERQYSRGHWMVALRLVNKSLSQFPDKPRLYLMKGSLLRKLGEKKMALSAYEKALGLQPEDRERLEELIDELKGQLEE